MIKYLTYDNARQVNANDKLDADTDLSMTQVEYGATLSTMKILELYEVNDRTTHTLYSQWTSARVRVEMYATLREQEIIILEIMRVIEYQQITINRNNVRLSVLSSYARLQCDNRRQVSDHQG